MAKPDRIGCDLHSAKHDIIERRTQPKSNADRWCCFIEYHLSYSVCLCTDAYSYTSRCQSFPDGWSNCRPNAEPISRCCTYLYIDRRCYTIAYSYTLDRCRIFEHSCYFSVNSNRKCRCHVIGHSCQFDSCADSRCCAIDYTRHNSADSYYDADSSTVERNRHFDCCIVERSCHFHSCFECRCFDLGFGWWFHADSFADAGCAVERDRELPADYCTNRR